MKIIKRYFLLIILILTVIGNVFCGVFLKNQADNYRAVKLSDVQGDRTLLKNIKISGIVADTLHKQVFEIENGSAKTEFSEVTNEERNDFDSDSISEIFDIVHYEFEPLEVPTEAKTVTANEANVFVSVNPKAHVSFSLRTSMTIKNEEFDYSFEYWR